MSFENGSRILGIASCFLGFSSPVLVLRALPRSAKFFHCQIEIEQGIIVDDEEPNAFATGIGIHA